MIIKIKEKYNKKMKIIYVINYLNCKNNLMIGLIVKEVVFLSK